MLIKVMNNIFKRFMLIYFNYNSKNESRIEVSYLVFIFKIDRIKRNL